jgi:hypothetical protein
MGVRLPKNAKKALFESKMGLQIPHPGRDTRVNNHSRNIKGLAEN